jgi:hypothetical protein
VGPACAVQAAGRALIAAVPFYRGRPAARRTQGPGKVVQADMPVVITTAARRSRTRPQREREPLGTILVYPSLGSQPVHNWMISAQSRT